MSSAETAPPVCVLLSLDEEYRELAETEQLPRIAPQRNNLEHEAWLPVWNVQRGKWTYRIMYSNSTRAHALGREHDWVVLHWHDASGHHGVNTVVTEYRGMGRGRRVLRGHEAESLDLRTNLTPRSELSQWAEHVARSLSST